MQHQLDIYTDASFSYERHSKLFSTGLLIIEDDSAETEHKHSTALKTIHAYEGVKEIYRAQMCDITLFEIEAALRGLLYANKILPNYETYVLYTDSLNFFNMFHGLAKVKMKYRILLQKILDFASVNNIEIRWVKGHSKVYGNSIVDKLASRSLKKKTKNLNKSVFQN